MDFIADNPGDTLWHCHQQLHMDYGFMQLIKYSDKRLCPTSKEIAFVLLK